MGTTSTEMTTAEIEIARRESARNGAVNGHATNGHSVNDQLPDDWLHDPLEAMTRARGPYTLDNADDYLDQEAVELYNGWLVWQAMTHIRERTILGTIQSMLDLSARKVGFGQMLPDQAECLLNNGNVFKPDASLISWPRLDRAATPQGPNDRILLIECPELVIESRSPSNWRKQEAMKRAQYFANGTEIVWDVDEPNRVIYVYHASAPEKPTRYGEGDEITCPYIPNWRRKVADIFDEHVSAEKVAGEVAVAWRTEGIEIGEARGIEIGEARGIEIGRNEGEIAARRQSLLLLLQHKFGAVPATVMARINHTTATAQFDQWMLQLMTAGDLAEIEWGETNGEANA